MTGPHALFNPPELSPAVGFSHAVAAVSGRLVFLGGQTAQEPDGSVADAPLVEQFGRALSNLVVALQAAGASPEHLVQIVIYTTQIEEYRSHLTEIGMAYRSHLGTHYPAMALVGIGALFDPLATVELLATAVVPT